MRPPPDDSQHDRPARRPVIDSDVDLHDPAQRDETRPHEFDLLAAVAAGGVIGAEARYGLGLLWPSRPSDFPWATLVVNLSGCLLIGALMVLLIEVWSAPRLARPFLGVGILGGYTTFSTFGVEAVALMHAHRPGAAGTYVAVSVLGCVLAVHVATALSRRLARVDAAATAQ